MTPGIDAAHISTAMLAVELSGRLRRADEQVSECQNALPIAALWGDGTKGSADMMALDASRHLCGRPGWIHGGAPMPQACTPMSATAGACSTIDPSC